MATTEPRTVELPDELRDLIDGLHESANVTTVFGDPIERDGRTVVPVARVAYGFGGGFGSGTDESGEGGIGGGVGSRPVGTVEITDHETRFVPIPSRRRQAATVGAFLLGVVPGALLGRRR